MSKVLFTLFALATIATSYANTEAAGTTEAAGETHAAGTTEAAK
jgi:hypothetical protein